MRKFNESPVKQALMSRAKEFYLNDALHENIFHTNPEYITEAIGTCYLNEAANATDYIRSFFGEKSDNLYRDLSALKLNKSPYFIDLERSGGDITKTSYYKTVGDLMKYSNSVNDQMIIGSTGSVSKGMSDYSNATAAIQQCIRYMEGNANNFRSAISKERTTANSRKLASMLYQSIVYLIQTTADILYSSSISADFDYNVKPPVAKNITFVYESGLIDEALEAIRTLNLALSNGTIRKFLSTGLQEDLDFALNQVSLNENIGDVVFSLISHFKMTDAIILLPIYLIRMVTYVIYYCYKLFKKISFNIEQSIELQKSKIVTRDQFDKYKHDTSKQGRVVGQNIRRAETTLEMEAGNDKNALNRMQQSNVLI